MEKTKLQFIFWLGKGAAGKDTQAAIILSKSPTAICRSTGDIYRSAKNNIGEFARYHSILEPYINNVDGGGYIPDNPIVDIVGEIIQNDIASGKRIFLYTGFPRTVIQLNLLDDMFSKMSEKFEISANYIYYPVSDETVRERSLKRYQLEERDDDRPESVEKKLETFYELTKPLIFRLSIEDRLIVINGERSISEIEAETSLRLSKER